MSGKERCDEILRLIDQTLAEYQRKTRPTTTTVLPARKAVQ